VLFIRFSEVVILFYILIGLNCIYVSTPVGPIYCPNYFLLNLQEVYVCEYGIVKCISVYSGLYTICASIYVNVWSQTHIRLS
jgi:hypothetical protein